VGDLTLLLRLTDTSPQLTPCTQRVPTPPWPPLENGKRQVGDLPLVVEVGRLELHVACLPRPRLEGHGLSEVRFRSPPVTARAR
jgi:hypothetical protein